MAVLVENFRSGFITSAIYDTYWTDDEGRVIIEPLKPEMSE